ncbi:hypothetical protein AKJ16_DCAP16882, partial [Drosera capensis]
IHCLVRFGWSPVTISSQRPSFLRRSRLAGAAASNLSMTPILHFVCGIAGGANHICLAFLCTWRVHMISDPGKRHLQSASHYMRTKGVVTEVGCVTQ